MKRVIIALGLLFLSSTAMADSSVTILDGKAIEPKRAALFFSVLDDAGRPVKGLSKGNFKLLVGGKEIKAFTLEPVSTTQENLSLILGIDVSGSMKGKPFNETQKAISIFLDQLDRGDFISLLSFGTKVNFLTEFTQERHKVREEVESLKAVENWTHLYEATYDGLKQGKKEAPTARVAFIIITDGRNDVENPGDIKVTRSKALDKARGSSIPVFTIGFGHKIDRPYLKELAEVSKGYFLSTPRPENIDDLYRKVLDQLKSQYMMSFNFAKAPGPYKAILTLDYKDRKTKASKGFVFSPEGEYHGDRENLVRLLRGMTWQQWVIAGSVLLAILVLGFVYFKRRRDKEAVKNERWKKELKEMILYRAEGEDARECHLEFPEDSPTGVEFMNSRQGSKTKLETGAERAFLKVDCLKGQKVPLIYQGREVVTELIVARESEGRKHFKKEGAVYLWAPQNDTYISRPSDASPGHVRIFYMADRERFAVEDIKKIGTLVDGFQIKESGVVPLQDGNVIDVGNKKGLRIVYRESEPESEFEDASTGEETTIGE